MINDGEISYSNYNGMNFGTEVKTLDANRFENLFRGNTSITGAVTFPELTTINGGYSAFYYCFRNCSNLTKVYFPKLTTFKGSTGITNYMFAGCTKLTEVHFRSDLNSTQQSNVQMYFMTSMTSSAANPFN